MLETDNLLNKIYEKYDIYSSEELIEAIKSILNDEKPEEIISETISNYIEDDNNDSINSNDSNPFYISKTDLIYKIVSAKDMKKYIENIQDIHCLMDFFEEVGDDAFPDYFKLFKKLSESLKKKFDFEYDKDKDMAEILAETIKKVILEKNIKKIAIAIYRGINNINVESDEKAFLEDLLEYMNKYLKNIGVYTYDAHVGDLYDGDLLYHFENITENPNSKSAVRHVTRIECPSYELRYLDENNDEQIIYIQGKCLID